jgi:hypothetical protein
MNNWLDSGPTDWQLLAVILLRRLGGSVELSTDEIADARRLFDPAECETLLLTYHASFLTPELLTIELRSRPRATIDEALDAFLNEVLKGGGER